MKEAPSPTIMAYQRMSAGRCSVSNHAHKSYEKQIVINLKISVQKSFRLKPCDKSKSRKGQEYTNHAEDF